MRNILVPTDFSDVAKNALKFAIKIAHPLKSRIILLHSIHPILIANDAGFMEYPDAFEKEIESELIEKMDELVEFVKSQNVYAEKIIQKGLLMDDITTIVAREDIDMIVTGTNGAKGLEALFFGTNSMSIFEKVKCPVFIVPETAKYHGIKKIMYATDFQYGDIPEIAKICKLAQPFNAEVIVTHINTDPNKTALEEDTIDWFAEIGDDSIHYKNISYKLIYNSDIAQAIEESINKMNIDILCMSSIEKSFFKKLVSKSNTKAMAYHSRIPLIALHLDQDNKLS